MAGQELLLLDNDARIVELLSWYLGERGYSVRSVGSFAQAREAIRERRPELLVSDVDLGTESALVELPRLSAEGQLPPTLVVSGYLDADVTGRLEAVPEVMGTVAKPFEFPDLEASIEACFARLSGQRSDVPLLPPEKVAPLPSDPASAETEDDDGWIEITPRG